VDQEEQTGRSITQLSTQLSTQLGTQLSGRVSVRSRQRGWVGVIVLLVVVVIVALLAQSALKQYGLLPAGVPVAKPGDPPRGPGVGQAPVDSSAATPAPAAPMERARNVERTLQRDTQDLSRRIDEQTK